ncbi:hypothetical protein [Paracoccus binzhouensis]|uniref:hypothetical protein n=1 Tax=Paracoccus binzhouensis TaxID=2796149 RepID=UPI0018EEE6E2|nr:hypothetical protein [Paracoccus binzhouensis]
MTSKPSKSDVKQAVFEERQKLRGAADILDDSAAVDAAQLAAISRRAEAWERRYDALGG